MSKWVIEFKHIVDACLTETLETKFFLFFFYGFLQGLKSVQNKITPLKDHALPSASSTNKGEVKLITVSPNQRGATAWGNHLLHDRPGKLTTRDGWSAEACKDHLSSVASLTTVSKWLWKQHQHKTCASGASWNVFPWPSSDFSCSTMTAQSRSIKARFDVFGVEELKWSSQCPDFNCTEHLWNELECQI